MQNPVTFEILYDEYQQQVEWINDNAWRSAQPQAQYRVQRAVARALIAMANLLTPAEAPNEAQTA